MAGWSEAAEDELENEAEARLNLMGSYRGAGHGNEARGGVEMEVEREAPSLWVQNFLSYPITVNYICFFLKILFIYF